MRIHRLTTALMAFALIGLFLATIAPPAAAQGTTGQAALILELKSQTADQELIPLQSPIELKGKVTFSGDPASYRSSLTGIQVSLEKVSGPAWATIVFSPPIVSITAEAAPGENNAKGSADFTVLVSASQEAPAFQETEVKIQAKLQGSTFIPTATQSATASVRAAYFSILDVAVPETIKVERPQTPVSFPITITNFGNGPTKVNFELLAPPGEGDKMQIVPPQAITLESRQTGGSAITKDAILQVQTPYKNGYLNEPRSVTVKLASHYATNTQLAGAADQVTVLVTTKGFYVPGPSPILVVGLLGLAALVVRKLRN